MTPTASRAPRSGCGNARRGRNVWAAIQGANAAGYTPVAADSGEFLRVTAIYEDKHGSGNSVSAATSNVALGPLLTVLQVTTEDSTADPTHGLRPAFDAEILHYAIGCAENDTMTLNVSAGSGSRVAVDGQQVDRSGGSAGVTVTPESDVAITVTLPSGAHTNYVVHCITDFFVDMEAIKRTTTGVLDELILFPYRSYLAIVDNNGVPRYRQEHSIRGTRMYFRFYRVGETGAYRYHYTTKARTHFILDEDLQFLDVAFTVLPLRRTGIHDFRILDDGNYLLMSYEPAVPRDLSYFTFTDLNGEPYGTAEELEDSAIQIVTPQEESVFTWTSWGNMPLEDCTQHSFDDYAHVNSVQKVDGHVVASFRGCSRVLAIDTDTGEVAWRVGRSNLNPDEWTARDIGPAPMDIVGDPEGEFCGQHAARILSNGNLLLYDNGEHCLVDPWTGTTERPGFVFSRAVEYVLDFENSEAVFLRDHSLHGTRNRAGAAGGHVETLDTGDWLISWGRPGGQVAVDEAVTQVNPDTGEERFSLIIPDIDRLGAQANIRATTMPPWALAKQPVPLTATFPASSHTTVSQPEPTDPLQVVVAFNQPVVDFTASSSSLSVQGATVAAVRAHVEAGEPANAYLVTLTPDGADLVSFALLPDQVCPEDGICTADGTTLTEVPAAIGTEVEPVVVSFQRSVYAVDEGGTVTIGVRLDQDPERTVTIPLTATHGGDATADDYTAPAEVVFTAGETSRELTVTATDDQVAETGETLTLAFGTLPVGVSVGATAEAVVQFGDDDRRGIALSPESLTLIEGGSSHSYTVQLLSQPTSAVTVSVNVELPSSVSALSPPVRVNPMTLSFSVSNWNTPQTVRVTPNHDADALDAAATLNHTASGGGYDNETASFPVTVTDDEAPVTPGTGRIQLSATTLSIEEERGSSYTVQLASEPVSRVTVRITGHEGTDLSVYPDEFEFVLSNWRREQRVTLSFAHDQDREDHTMRLTHTAYGREDYEGVAARLTVAVEDNDPHGTLAPLPQVSIVTELTSGTEGDDVVFTLTRTGDRTEALTVSVEVEETGGMIRGRRSTRTTFERGSGTAALTVNTDDDSLDEASSVISATVLEGTGYEAGRPVQASVTVADNDPAGSSATDGGVPVVRGTPRVGEELLADMSRVYDSDGLPDGNAFRFTWLLALTEDDVKEDTNGSGRYTPVVEDIGRTVAVRVTYTDDGGNAEERTSSATRAVTATTPGAPGIQPSYFYAEPGYGEVTLSWSAPESDGGSEITRYQHRQRTASGGYGSWINASYSDGQGYQSTVTGLRNGTEYRFQIRAVNAVGAGPESPEVYATPADGGICGRTAQVKGRILLRLKLLHQYEGNCLGVEEDHLAKLTLLDIANTGITNIGPGDFAGLTGVTTLDLSFNSLTTLPDGVFEGLTGLEELNLANNQLRSIETGVFVGLATLGKLRLLKNELSSFPFDELEQLPKLTSLSISGNPGFRKGIQVSADRLEVTAGSSVEYRVRLLRPDAGRVSVNEDADGVSVSPTGLTFTKKNWFRSQTFTVTVDADADAAAGQVVLTHSTSGLDPGSDRLPEVTVVITTNTDGAASGNAAPSPPPKNLRTVRDKAAVELTWDAPGDALVIGYRIDRRSAGEGRSEEQTLVEDTGSADTGYTDQSAKSGVEYEYRVSARTADGLGEASEWVSAGPEPPGNRPATGEPAITGTAQVGETLTADTSGIADEDGLENVSFSYQWLADDTAIQGATGSAYTLAEADEGKAIKVQVRFTDDVGNEESLTSGPTDAVAVPLTASLENTPDSHDGENVFTFELRFSEEFSLSYKILRDYAFTVAGGTVENAKRITKGSNIRWRITVRPDGDGQVTITLPVTEDCDAEGAICTGDGRMLSNELVLTVSRPGG